MAAMDTSVNDSTTPSAGFATIFSTGQSSTESAKNEALKRRISCIVKTTKTDESKSERKPVDPKVRFQKDEEVFISTTTHSGKSRLPYWDRGRIVDVSEKTDNDSRVSPCYKIRYKELTAKPDEWLSADVLMSWHVQENREAALEHNQRYIEATRSMFAFNERLCDATKPPHVDTTRRAKQLVQQQADGPLPRNVINTRSRKKRLLESLDTEEDAFGIPLALVHTTSVFVERTDESASSMDVCPAAHLTLSPGESEDIAGQAKAAPCDVKDNRSGAPTHGGTAYVSPDLPVERGARTRALGLSNDSGQTEAVFQPFAERSQICSHKESQMTEFTPCAGIPLDCPAAPLSDLARLGLGIEKDLEVLEWNDRVAERKFRENLVVLLSQREERDRADHAKQRDRDRKERERDRQMYLNHLTSVIDVLRTFTQSS